MDFDIWGWWRYCVKTLQIAPTEAWKMDFVEISHLMDEEHKTTNIDVSVMLNYERVKNGVDAKWLQSL
jgi:hypothetical protein